VQKPVGSMEADYDNTDNKISRQAFYKYLLFLIAPIF
jgi:hypothetical protein